MLSCFLSFSLSQLGAVIKKAFYENPTTDPEKRGREVYRELMKSAIVLTKNFRQQADLTGFAGICMRLREGVVSDEDIAVLNSRFHPDKWAAVETMPLGGAYSATTRVKVLRLLID